MSRPEQNRLKRLDLRRQRLLVMIRDLQDLLREVTAELQQADAELKPKLNQQFFQEVVRPLLERARKPGLTARELYHELKGAGADVGYDNVRLFLTRAAKKGMIVKTRMQHGPYRWGLAQEASQ